MIGETLGKYKVVEHLGRGGMAEVYKAYQPGLDRYVAIKVLHAFLASEENFLTRFQREAKAVAALRHANIVQVHDFDHDEERDIYYMVMEFIDGPNLKMRLQELAARSDVMPLDEAVSIAIGVGEALHYAHRRGMAHRDVKPANIMFTEDGQVILADFGIARMVDVAGLTASGAMVGTPAYISPEQGLGQAGDERSDIYSLGVVFYQLLTGVLPFDADTSMGIVLKHINELPLSPRSIRPEIPVALEHVVMRALAKQPDQRYQAAAQFAADLRRAMAGQKVQPPSLEATTTMRPLATSSRTIPMQPTPPPGTPPPVPWYTSPPAQPPRRRRTWARVLLVLALLLALTGLTGLALRGQLDGLLSSVGLPPIFSTPTPDVGATRLAETVVAMQATMSAPTGTPLPPTITPTPSRTPDLTATAFASCVFDLEVIQDHPVWPFVLMPGQRFVKRWEIVNTGTCAWPQDVELAFVSGDELEIVELPEIASLSPDETMEIEVVLRAPTSYETYASVWRLRDGRGNPIGEGLEIACRVGATLTPQPTATMTATLTPESTSGPYQPLWMSEPVLGYCYGPGGRIEWGAGGGPGGEYHYFWGEVIPENELEGPFHQFEGFAHIETYFTTSGPGIPSLPENCCTGDERWYETEDGHEVVWRKVYFAVTDCP